MPVLHAPERISVLRQAALCAGLAAVYFVGGFLGLKLAFEHPSATPVWPPTGLALAAVLLLGYRMWPGILVGALCVNLTTPGTVGSAAGIAVGNTLEALVGAFLVRRFARGEKAFDTPSTVFKYAFFAALVATAVSATVGVASISVDEPRKWVRYGSIWLTWWLGDLGGALLLAPVIVLWSSRRRDPWDRRGVLEAAIVFLSLVLTGAVLFLGWIPLSSRNYPIAFLCLPVLGWVAFRFGPRETATSSLLLAAIATWGTLRGHGPFGGRPAAESLVLLQAFMGVLTVMALVLAAAVRDRRKAEDELRERHDQLQRMALALQESRERIRLIVESALDATITMDSQGLITGWNAQAQKTFGWFPLEAIGRTLAETIIPERMREAHRRGLKRFLETGEGPALNKRLEFDAIHRDGHEFPVELSITTFRVRGEVQFAGFVRDITERRRAEREIRDLNKDLERRVAERTSELREALKELEAFSYTIAHDLRAPLRAMGGFSQALLEDHAPRLDENGRDYLARIADSAKRMDRLILELLDYSRMMRADVHVEPVDLEEVALKVIAQLSDEIGARGAKIAVDRPLPRVLGNAVTLDQVLSNLLSNALKFVARGVAPRVRVRAESRGDRVRLWIEDNGIGIGPEHHDRIFGVFQRLHTAAEYPGSGIGLAIVRKAVERMGGKAGLESELGKGSKFWIELRHAEAHDASELHRPLGRE